MSESTGANLGFEDGLWTAADKLHGTMDAVECKHVVLGLIFKSHLDAWLELIQNALVKTVKYLMKLGLILETRPL